MSYNTELQSNNAELQEILDAVNDLPDAGGGGGGVETCTVTINSFDNNIQMVEYCSYENGEYKYYELLYDQYPNSVTLQNVLCGARLVVNSSYYYCGWNFDTTQFAYSASGGSSISGNPIIPNSNIILTLFDDD